MPTGSDHAWNAQVELNQIDEDEYSQATRDLLDNCREAVEDLAVELELEEA
ncbi:hypothetical protein [Halorarum salinum]|uniref:Uncharacterized protein n=1 Tax=Halorarum salinum TaxID=2743089 RepID=A0A7D5QHP8_9EURY|nr:hypothetical protein [Halobaculum salinum]QLG63063.1 hypothetical protein HUG12_15515 [Halobaculum salinum]